MVEDVPAAGVVYAQADGAMVLTDEGYKENKLARIFKATDLKESVVENRGRQVASSLICDSFGEHADFIPKLTTHLGSYQHLDSDLVFLSDGALWLRQMIQHRYPKATLILDFFHALSYIGQPAVAAFSAGNKAHQWIEKQHQLVLNSDLDIVIAHINTLEIETNLRDSITNYLHTNADRMDYHIYRQRGLLIGSVLLNQ